MAVTNHERVGKALELLKSGLGPFIQREFLSLYKEHAVIEVRGIIDDDRFDMDRPMAQWDVAVLLKIMWASWNTVFRLTLGHSERSLVSELRDIRNKWAHQETFSSDDTYRALDSISRLLAAVSAPEADAVEKMKMELLRLRFDEQVRSEKRKTAGTAVESAAASGLKPWREVVTPHPDVAGGRYQQAEFAADLWQVHLGEGSDEYRDPREFFRRTFLTESLKTMLVGGIKRIAGQGGDPVIQLQTNFGGGKTHSMLALYHLFSGTSPTELAGVDEVMQEAGIQTLPTAKRVVLVGNKISPGNPSRKPDGIVVNTLWGELAWQLGGKAAYERIRADDEKGTSPGDAIRELLKRYGPCLVLIDEWVAYARQLHDQSDLPGGGFETQFSFAQALTESAKLAGNCLLVISLPASDTAGSSHTRADDVEVGGQRGREALDRLRNVVGRIESSWRPASAEEGFEIVRRRLFEPMTDPTQFKDRDVTARIFSDFYRSQGTEFPPECRDADYEKRIKAAYPIHPEIFDRLYTDWSTLVKFQRTRGVLRLMAAVIHSLWEKGDKNPLITPANIPIDESRVQFELTRYLSDNWVPVIEKDVDGPNSLPLQIDADVTNLGKFAACRRVARAIYLGSAPLMDAARRGIEDRRIKLGCLIPGESPAVFGDALRRLAAVGTYLYQDGQRYWYSTQPTVTKLADDRAEQLKRDPDKVIRELNHRLDENLQTRGDFLRVHTMPVSGQDVPDDPETRLVVLGIDHAYSKGPSNSAEIAAKAIFESRGTAPRMYRNALVFLAPDKSRLQDLDEAVRNFLAWESILSETDQLNLDPQQVRQAKTQKNTADGAANARLPETFQWMLVPVQPDPKADIQWQSFRLTGQEALAVRVSRKLKNDELMVTSYAATLLRMELDRIPLWRGENHIAVRQLVNDFSSFPYLPRLKGPSVLINAIQDGLSLLTWSKDTFAYADSFDEGEKRYRGLKTAQAVSLSSESPQGCLVKPDVALKQVESEKQPVPGIVPPTEIQPGEDSPPPTDRSDSGSGVPGTGEQSDPGSNRPKRFFGSVTLDTTRVVRDAGKIAEEVIAHLSGIVGADVKITLEIAAQIPDGVSDQIVRIVTENSRTLGFNSHGFEKE
jgi:predicted AAA+ superfamily ATPase